MISCIYRFSDEQLGAIPCLLPDFPAKVTGKVSRSAALGRFCRALFLSSTTPIQGTKIPHIYGAFRLVPRTSGFR